MVRRAGSADLPLHGGHVPSWLARRMTRLGAVIVEAIVLEYGRDELLRRLAHPFWFQSFGAVMGMDWHSSGITTSVLGALKRGLAPLSHELGFTSAAAGAGIAEQPQTNWSQSVSVSAWTGRPSPDRAAWSPRSTAPPCRTVSTFICMASSSPTMAGGWWCSRA